MYSLESYGEAEFLLQDALDSISVSLDKVDAYLNEINHTELLNIFNNKVKGPFESEKLSPVRQGLQELIVILQEEPGAETCVASLQSMLVDVKFIFVLRAMQDNL